MKVLAKPMSSPGRAEKYPPPLMRFLRSNVGSRSRGRSRSSPMFVLRKKTAAIETQEPTSPKVTCMGQVRVRRSKQPGKRTGAPTTKRRCKWLNKAFFCLHFDGKIKPKSLKPVWPKWVRFCRMSFRSKSKIREESSKTESKFGSKSEDFVQEEAEEEEDTKVFVSSSSTPPRNALLLTRCRSAPYRSSSLASRFWGSPLASKETEKNEASTTTRTEPQNRGNENPTSGRESNCRDSDQESRMDPETGEKLELFKEFDAPISKIREKFMKSEELKTEDMVTVRPLMLTRCKSEPARTGERLDPDMIFLDKRR
ncbi:uncharacterized protein LOC123215842 [Mangifera indica]|uniref:uncharacterized protein LOC123215842 n=1 Tax=Mangifera indica TaxID=29780 RepID=UPI001CFBD5DD|nr:uncharacterized protein LOC123215842 [Mangifera indica]